MLQTESTTLRPGGSFWWTVASYVVPIQTRRVSCVGAGGGTAALNSVYVGLLCLPAAWWGVGSTEQDGEGICWRQRTWGPLGHIVFRLFALAHLFPFRSRAPSGLVPALAARPSHQSTGLALFSAGRGSRSPHLNRVARACSLGPPAVFLGSTLTTLVQGLSEAELSSPLAMHFVLPAHLATQAPQPPSSPPPYPPAPGPALCVSQTPAIQPARPHGRLPARACTSPPRRSNVNHPRPPLTTHSRLQSLMLPRPRAVRRSLKHPHFPSLWPPHPRLRDVAAPRRMRGPRAWCCCSCSVASASRPCRQSARATDACG